MVTFSGAALLLLALTVVLSVLIPTLRTGVPPVPAARREVEAVVRLLAAQSLPPTAIIYELGCGFGGTVCALGARFPQARVVGIEMSWVPWLVARLRAPASATIVRGDYRTAELGDADAVTCFLMRGPMPSLALQLDAALRPGTPVVTVAFRFPSREPESAVPGAGPSDVSLYLWAPPTGPAALTSPAASFRRGV